MPHGTVRSRHNDRSAAIAVEAYRARLHEPGYVERNDTSSIGHFVMQTLRYTNAQHANSSSEPDCSHNQQQACPDHDGSDRSRGALTCRRKTFDGEGYRHDGHHAQVHDADDEEYRHQTGAAITAMDTEPQPISPSGTRVCGR